MNEDTTTVIGTTAGSLSHTGPGGASIGNRARRGKNTPHESARDALLRVMVETLDECGEPGVRLEKILRDADASVSSMYHHFGNLAGLIETAQIVRFRRTQQLDVDFMTTELQSVSNVDEFRDLVKRSLARALHDDRRLVRAQRINAAARSYQNPGYAEQLQTLQRESNYSLMLVLLQAQAKGFIPATIDIEVASAWWASTLHGRYFVEILNDSSLEDRVNGLTQQLCFSVLGISE